METSINRQILLDTRFLEGSLVRAQTPAASLRLKQHRRQDRSSVPGLPSGATRFLHTTPRFSTSFFHRSVLRPQTVRLFFLATQSE
jgi:hypothetical protein